MSKQYAEYPPMDIDPDKSYTATIKTTKGDIVCELYADKTPKTVNSFVFLANEGFYDDVIFHRIIKNFMAQTGDPEGTGTGGPGYRFEDEFHPALRHDGPGVLSMANSGPNTNGSQLFLTHVSTPHLDNLHSVFGRVVAGLDVLLSIEERDPRNVNAHAEKIESIEIAAE